MQIMLSPQQISSSRLHKEKFEQDIIVTPEKTENLTLSSDSSSESKNVEPQLINKSKENNHEDIFEDLQQEVQNSGLPESVVEEMLKNIINLRNQKPNIMITGATGCGKSSTINALFDADVAKVGTGVDPETMEIQKYTLKNFILWDSPGLGDGKEADARHSANIIRKLTEVDDNGYLLIDLVLVILDGSSRDLGTSYELINNVIIPNLGVKKDRILVAINKADLAKGGRHWNHEKNAPDFYLKNFLDEKVQSVRRRIREGTGVDIEPIYYSAGYKESEDEKQNPYNMYKLLYYIIEHMPKEKVISVIENVTKDEEVLRDNDNEKDYSRETGRILGKVIYDNIVSPFVDCVEAGMDIGEAIGSKFGETGKTIGGTLGTAFGLIAGTATTTGKVAAKVGEVAFDAAVSVGKKAWNWLF